MNSKFFDIFTVTVGFLTLIFFCAIGLSVYQVRIENQKLRSEVKSMNAGQDIINARVLERRIENDERMLNLESDIKIKPVKIGVIEESLDPENTRWAKIKQIREAFYKAKKDKRLSFRFANTEELTDYASSLVRWSERFDVPIALIMAVAHRESNFDPRVESPAGAIGIMQLMWATAKDIAPDADYHRLRKKENLKKVKLNTRLGVFYLSKMLDEFDRDFSLAVRAYNTGPTNVRKVLAKERPDYYHETKCYVRAILGDNVEDRPFMESCDKWAKNTVGFFKYYEKMGL